MGVSRRSSLPRPFRVAVLAVLSIAGAVGLSTLLLLFACTLASAISCAFLTFAPPAFFLPVRSSKSDSTAFCVRFLAWTASLLASLRDSSASWTIAAAAARLFALCLSTFVPVVPLAIRSCCMSYNAQWVLLPSRASSLISSSIYGIVLSSRYSCRESASFAELSIMFFSSRIVIISFNLSRSPANVLRRVSE